MKKLTLLVVAVMVVLSVVLPTVASACPCDCNALFQCYHRCASIYGNFPGLLSACNLGCLIACYSHSAS